MEFVQIDELFEQSQVLFVDAKALASNKDATAEDLETAARMFEDGKKKRARSAMLQSLEGLAAAAMPQAPAPKPNGDYKSLGAMLCSIHNKTFRNVPDPRLIPASVILGAQDGKGGWATEAKDLVENIGASGGFTVFPEHLNTLFQMEMVEHQG